jgi:hypothetical protein
VTEIWEPIREILANAGTLLVLMLGWIARWSLAIAWFAWWLWGVDWAKVWSILRRGAWVAVVLAMLVGAMVWAELDPGSRDFLGVFPIANFWWQLGGVSLLVGLTLCCGWLQSVFNWQPAPISIEPSEVSGNGHAVESAHH